MLVGVNGFCEALVELSDGDGKHSVINLGGGRFGRKKAGRGGFRGGIRVLLVVVIRFSRAIIVLISIVLKEIHLGVGDGELGGKNSVRKINLNDAEEGRRRRNRQ